MNDKKYDLLCIGTALVDSIIRGFDPVPISASGFVAQSASLHVGGEAVNEAITASRLGLRTAIRPLPTHQRPLVAAICTCRNAGGFSISSNTKPQPSRLRLCYLIVFSEASQYEVPALKYCFISLRCSE